MSFDLDSYVDVAERIRLFYEKFPDGRLTRKDEPKTIEVGPKLFVCYTALAYRTADDPIPAIGSAWEVFPGPTQFTRDSELMNAETAAWGRAIIACGIGSRKIASQEEVRARQTPEPPAHLTESDAAALILRADDAGIDRAALHKAAQHACGHDLPSFGTDAATIAQLQALTVQNGIRVGRWIDKKAATKPEPAEPALKRKDVKRTGKSDIPSDAPPPEAPGDTSDVPFDAAYGEDDPEAAPPEMAAEGSR